MGHDFLKTTKDEQVVTEHNTSQEASYWSDFYSQHDFTKGSTFFESLKDRTDIPATILEFGCGQGRDSIAFAHAGKTVIGVDRSITGIEHAMNQAVNGDLDDLAFAVCDVSDEAETCSIIEKARNAAGEGPLCFYSRFFLHSIPEDAQDTLLASIQKQAQTGDVFAAEFRTDKDEQRDKAFGKSHYRRYQNAEAFATQLSEQYGWTIVHEIEDTGLSPYGDEDPVLYRVIATKQ